MTNPSEKFKFWAETLVWPGPELSEEQLHCMWKAYLKGRDESKAEIERMKNEFLKISRFVSNSNLWDAWISWRDR
jgi:hypothetical protein